MDDITQTLINECMKRIGSLEDKVKTLMGGGTPKENPKPQAGNINASTTQNASTKQIKFLKDLGITIERQLTKHEAKMLIKEGLEKRDIEKNDNTTAKPEQTDTPRQADDDNKLVGENDDKEATAISEPTDEGDVYDEEHMYL